jgi:hypothetical protein
MPSLATEQEPAVDLIEMSAPADQLVDSIRRFAHDHLDDLGIAESLASGEGIGDVVVEAVLRVQNPGDSSLSIVAVAFTDLVLGHDEGPELIGNAKRGTKTGNPASDDEYVSEMVG